MVGEPARIDVDGFLWDFGAGGNVEHLARHAIGFEDVEAVLRSDPLFFRGQPGPSRGATHAMVGRDASGRSLLIYMVAAAQHGIWEPVTGWQSRLAHQLLAEEGQK